MAEAQRFTFKHKEVVEALIKKQGLHEGRWALYVRFGLNAANAGPSDDQLNPIAMVPILEIGLSRTDKDTNLSVDAAAVNPAATGIGRRAPGRR